MTLFDGDPGVGKSYFALAVAANLSTGAALPFDREPEAPLKSLIISSEDGAGDTIKPRLRMLGADMSMIVIPNRSLNLTPSSIDANLIDRILEQTGAALTIIDPIIAFANGRNTDRASEVRGLLGPLASMAEKHKTAVVLIRHLNKSTQGKALYRGQGSIDFAAVCRAAFIFAQDPENPERRMMAHSKASIAGLQSTVEYFINKDTGVFSWGGQTDETADEMMGGTALSKGRELERAIEFIETALASGPMACNELKRQAVKVGIAGRTLWRAKAEMDVEPKKHPSKDGEWWWRIANIGVWPWLVSE